MNNRSKRRNLDLSTAPGDKIQLIFNMPIAWGMKANKLTCWTKALHHLLSSFTNETISKASESEVIESYGRRHLVTLSEKRWKTNVGRYEPIFGDQPVSWGGRSPVLRMFNNCDQFGVSKITDYCTDRKDWCWVGISYLSVVIEETCYATPLLLDFT